MMMLALYSIVYFSNSCNAVKKRTSQQSRKQKMTPQNYPLIHTRAYTHFLKNQPTKQQQQQLGWCIACNANS